MRFLRTMDNTQCVNFAMLALQVLPVDFWPKFYQNNYNWNWNFLKLAIFIFGDLIAVNNQNKKLVSIEKHN